MLGQEVIESGRIRVVVVGIYGLVHHCKLILDTAGHVRSRHTALRVYRVNVQGLVLIRLVSSTSGKPHIVLACPVLLLLLERTSTDHVHLNTAMLTQSSTFPVTDISFVDRSHGDAAARGIRRKYPYARTAAGFPR